MISKEELEIAIEDIHGWLHMDEAYELYSRAAGLPQGSTIVEIGSFQGRSTVCLAMGAIISNSVVYAIDPHHIHEAGGLRFGPQDLSYFMNNIGRKHVAGYVRVINLHSLQAVRAWDGQIDLLFIDGGHEYEDVKQDYIKWNGYVSFNGTMAFHDSTGSWDGPTRVVQHILAEPSNWVKDIAAGYTTFLKRKI